MKIEQIVQEIREDLLKALSTQSDMLTKHNAKVAEIDMETLKVQALIVIAESLEGLLEHFGGSRS
jgi:hypothetical protein